MGARIAGLPPQVEIGGVPHTQCLPSTRHACQATTYASIQCTSFCSVGGWCRSRSPLSVGCASPRSPLAVGARLSSCNAAATCVCNRMCTGRHHRHKTSGWRSENHRGGQRNNNSIASCRQKQLKAPTHATGNDVYTHTTRPCCQQEGVAALHRSRRNLPAWA